MTKFYLDITTGKGCICNNIKKPSGETVQCIVRQIEFFKESLDTRLRITTGGSHGIGLSRSMYEELDPEGPYQSICGGSADCAVDLLERSWTTPDSVGNKLKFGGIGFESKDNVGFEPEYGTCPIEEKDTPLGLLSTMADE